MSSKSLGPTANLIRNSRLMAMPPPISHTLSDSQLFRSPYPTHQAITTPEASRSRGDWGLKRSIPRKVENTYIKFNDIDTIEHMTKIESAHDTVLTLKKWQEMDIPLQIRDTRARTFTSAFYFETAPTQANPGQTPQSTSQVPQPVWGYRKQFVQHMTPGQLKKFISNKLVPRRKEFEAFVDDWFRPQDSATETSAAPSADSSTQGDSSLVSPDSSASPEPSASSLPPNFPISPLSSPVKLARFDSNKAYNAVREFLQIPLREVPMLIHPSGGLHYILDTSFLENNPEYGPNRNREIPIRLVHKLDNKVIDTFRRRTFYIIGGIAQFAQHESSTTAEHHSHSVSQVIRVTPLSAELDHMGKINIELDRFTAPLQLYRDLVGKSTDSAGSMKDDLEQFKNTSSPSVHQLTDVRGKSVERGAELDNRLVNLLSFLGDSGNPRFR